MNQDQNMEFEGNSVEEAIRKALKKLRLPRSKLKIKVIDEETKGLFGMPGTKQAKIRVSIIEEKEKT